MIELIRSCIGEVGLNDSNERFNLGFSVSTTGKILLAALYSEGTNVSFYCSDILVRSLPDLSY